LREYLWLGDQALPCCINDTYGLGVVQHDSWSPSIVNPISVDYTRPKTGHPYAAHLQYLASLPTDATPAPSPYCAPNGGLWQCLFDLSVPVPLAPEVGPAPARAPVDRALTLTRTDGSTCALTLDLTAADANTLSYNGASTCPSNSGPSSTFVYADRREATRIQNGSSVCGGCPASSPGQIPAVPGATYTATYYVFVEGAFSTPLADDCWSGDSPITGPYAQCELSGSVIFP
jgi:hypothetical protein